MREQPLKPPFWQFWRRRAYRLDFIAWRLERLAVWRESKEGMEPVKERTR